jgi:hypothetical protein
MQQQAAPILDCCARLNDSGANGLQDVQSMEAMEERLQIVESHNQRAMLELGSDAGSCDATGML